MQVNELCPFALYFRSDLYLNHNQLLSIAIHLLTLLPLFGFRCILFLIV